MVLVDSSIWIDYFKSDDESDLTNLLIENLVCTNEIILSELIPSAWHKKENEIIEGLNALPNIALDIDWDGIRLLQMDNLANGINKVGIPDLIITQQAIHNKIKLWTSHKHFKLMSAHMDFELFDSREIFPLE